MSTLPLLLTALILFAANIPALHAQATQAHIKTANELRCGLVTEEAEYSNLDAHGNRAAFDVDLCKAVAVAVLGTDAHFTVTPYPDEAESIKALKSGAIDLLPTASPSLTNTAGAGLAFSPVIFYDFQGIMANRALGIKTANDLAGRKICVLVETEMEISLHAYMDRRQIKFFPFPFQEEGEMEAAFITNNCAGLSADVSQLAYERVSFHNMAKNFEILPDVVARDPLAPVTRANDPAWTGLVSAVMQVLLQAEESGVTQANLPAMKKSLDPDIQRLLGVTGGIGKPVGLDDLWPTRVLLAVGNYGELFDRDLGSASPLHLDRGPNRLWNAGGLLYPLPLR